MYIRVEALAVWALQARCFLFVGPGVLARVQLRKLSPKAVVFFRFHSPLC